MKDQKFDQGAGKAKGVCINRESLYGNSGGGLEFVSLKVI